MWHDVTIHASHSLQDVQQGRRHHMQAHHLFVQFLEIQHSVNGVLKAEDSSSDVMRQLPVDVPVIAVQHAS
jgi:hypothetical protein